MTEKDDDVYYYSVQAAGLGKAQTASGSSNAEAKFVQSEHDAEFDSPASLQAKLMDAAEFKKDFWRA